MNVVSDVHELSRAAYDRLKAEFEDLTTRGRVDIARRIEAARELGDLSENGDYHAAKEEQGKMEGRIGRLSVILKNAKVVEEGEGAAGVVRVGSVVSIRYEGDSDVEQYLVGSIEERNTEYPVLSPGSPLGQELMGKQAGDVVSYQAPGGQLRVEVVAIDA
jgi:transcription elongation factor GreA